MLSTLGNAQFLLLKREAALQLLSPRGSDQTGAHG